MMRKWRGCPVHKAVEKLKRFAGLPVPYFATVAPSGKPDFTQMDPQKWLAAVTHKLCNVCGQKLGDVCWFIGGERSAESKLFADPPMHHACALASIELCPFLNGKRQHYRDAPTLAIQQTHERPARMHLLRDFTKNFQVVRAGNVPVIFAPDAEPMETF